MGERSEAAPGEDRERLRSSSRASAALRVVLALSALLFVGASGAFVASCITARRAAKSFAAAVRAGRLDDARALATVDFVPYLVGAAEIRGPDDAERRALEALRRSTDDRYSGVAGGFTEDCFSGSMDLPGRSDDLYLVVRREDGVWRVAEVASEARPEACDLDGD